MAADVNELHVTHQKTEIEMRQASIDRIKTLDINQQLQQEISSNIEDLICVRIERGFLMKEYGKDGTQILIFF